MIGHHRKRNLAEMDYEEALNHASSGMSDHDSNGHKHEETHDHSHPDDGDETNQYDSPSSNVLTDGEHIDYVSSVISNHVIYTDYSPLTHISHSTDPLDNPCLPIRRF